MEESNHGHEPSYGDDAWTQRATDGFRKMFGVECEIFFVFNGTAANSLALAALCQPFHSVICCDSAHIETDECGAPEFFSNGTKILTVPNQGGKLSLELTEQLIVRRNDIHFPKARVISISQATEFGTVYTKEEIRAVAQMAKRHHLRVHMDGARFANAVASLDVPPAELIEGIDILCFGGSKNGLAIGEAVVFFDLELAREFDYRCKQAGQLASKMRFLAAPWAGILETGAWLRNAAHANRQAKLLEAGLRGHPEIEVLHPCQANSVFVRMPSPAVKLLKESGWRFYNFIGGGCRMMCSWDTTDDDVQNLLEDVGLALRETSLSKAKKTP